jgi:hypothetical protein
VDKVTERINWKIKDREEECDRSKMLVTNSQKLDPDELVFSKRMLKQD